MHAQLIIDDRVDTAQIIRGKAGRRRSKTLFHLLTPFLDSSGEWINTDRRCVNERRNPTAI